MKFNRTLPKLLNSPSTLSMPRDTSLAATKNLTQSGQKIKQEYNSTSRVSYRAGIPADIPTLWLIVEEKKALYENDMEPASPDSVQEFINDGALITLTMDGFPVGGVAFTEVVIPPGWDHPLHFEIHGVVKPRFLRRVIKSGVFNKLLDDLFLSLKPFKIKARTLDGQDQAQRLLKSYGFKKLETLQNETTVNGEMRNVRLWELRRDYWLKGRGLCHSVQKSEESEAKRRHEKQPELLPHTNRIPGLEQSGVSQD